MAYDRNLEGRIDRAVRRWKGLDKKKMFGGICYLLHGNMCFGIHKDFLIVRTGPEKAEAVMCLDTTRPFDITGKAMKGWVMVTPSGYAGEEDMTAWLESGKDFALSLPKK